MTLNSRYLYFVFAAAALNLAAGQTSFAADNADSPEARERKLISVLQSDAPPQEKATTCKKLAIYGTKDAVPALAPLLANEQLASWARIALEVIPDPAADEALRAALPKLQGKLLIGVINSIGVRRDAKATDGLAEKLKAADADVASAAAEALGHIGGDPAAKALDKALGSARAEARSSVAYGCILCAEKYLAAGKAAEAVRLYDRVRQANVPKQRMLEATRGAILARQSGGIPLLLEQLKSADKARFNFGLRAARELPGREVTEALAAELDRASADRQAFLLLALADRNDTAVLPKVLQVAQNGPRHIRTTALDLLDRFRDVSAVPVLLTASAENDPELARTAKAALARLGGKEVDAALLASLPQATGKTRQVLIDLARQRRIDGALPVAMQSLEDADPGVRRSAIETVGVLGTDQQAADLVRLLPKAQNAAERDDLEKALVAICGRSGARCLPQVLPLAQSRDAAVRTIALHALASIGGAEALSAVKTAINDQDAAVQDEAVRTLSNWPNTWPDDAGVAEPLLALAKSGKKVSHQVQGLRGYLQYIQEDKKLTNPEKLGKINELLPLIKRPEEKQLAIAVLSTVATSQVLEPLMTFAKDGAVAEEACLAIVKVAGDNQKDAAKELRRQALQTALETSKNDATRKKAEAGLKRIN